MYFTITQKAERFSKFNTKEGCQWYGKMRSSFICQTNHFNETSFNVSQGVICIFKKHQEMQFIFKNII